MQMSNQNLIKIKSLRAVYIDLMRLVIQIGLIFCYGQDLEVFFLSSRALFQSYKVFNLYSFIVLLVITGTDVKNVIFSTLTHRNTAINEDNFPEQDRINAAHRHFHVRMGMRHQTIKCSKDKNFKEF